MNSLSRLEKESTTLRAGLNCGDASLGSPTSDRYSGRIAWAVSTKLVFLLALSLAACRDAGSCDNPLEAGCEGEEIDAPPGFAIAGTNVAHSPFALIHSQKASVVPRLGPSGELVGVALSSNNKTAFVQIGTDGRPTRAFSEGVIFLFGNYRDSANVLLVDIATVSSNHSITVRRSIAIPASAVSRLATDRPINGPSGHGPAFVPYVLAPGWHETASIILGPLLTAGAIYSCGVALVPGFGAAAILPCGSAIFSLAALPLDSRLFDAMNAKWDAIAAAIECNGGQVLGCAEFVYQQGAAVYQLMQVATQSRENAIRVAEGALDYSGGDVQVTLSWSTTADIDLYVTDPLGATISYQNRRSASGGQLDVDDTDGFGPENVFWPTGAAPAGQYRVSVAHFSGALPTSFTLLVANRGVFKTYGGVVTARGQSVPVVTFTLGQPLP